jgi:hypothetical protein
MAAKRASASLNTPRADINEILVGYYALGSTWTGFKHQKYVKEQLAKRRSLVGEDLYAIQVEQAKAMALRFLRWAKSNGFSGKPKFAWWTARPNTITDAIKGTPSGDAILEALGGTVDQDKNPTDTLFQYGTGKNAKFLGLSAKSTKGSGDIGFKNPGVGTIDKDLGTKLADQYKNKVVKFVDDINSRPGPSLSKTVSTRKNELRKTSKQMKPIAEAAQDAGADVLMGLRNSLYIKLKKLDQEALREYCLSSWMDVGDELLPVYVKVTGHGERPPFSATLMDPLKNNKTFLVQTGNITLSKVGDTSVGIKADRKKIFKMRFKWESQQMASSMKMSGDPWS